MVEQQDNEAPEKEIKDLPTTDLPEVISSKKEIKINPESLNIFRRMFIEIQNKQKEVEELKNKLDLIILISLTSNGVPELEFHNWRTDLDNGIHVEK